MSKRRGNAEGSIYQKTRTDGRPTWCAQISIGYNAEGKRKRRTLYGDTRADVVRQLDALRREVTQGIVANPGTLTVADLCTRFIEQIQRTKRATTAATYSNWLKHVTPHIGGVRLAKLAPVHILDLCATWERLDVAPRPRQGAFDVLKRALAFAHKARLISRNPAEDLDRPRMAKPEVRSLTKEQARAVLACANAGEAWIEVAVALGLCGMRRSEVFGLAWRDVNPDTGRVRVRQALTVTMDGERQLGELKSKSARREVPLTASAAAAFRRYRATFGDVIPHPAMLVFPGPGGDGIDFHNFNHRRLDALRRQAGVSFTFHQLRHTSATLLLGAGVDIKTVQAILGHARASHTLDIYADSIPANVDAAMEKIGAMLL